MAFENQKYFQLIYDIIKFKLSQMMKHLFIHYALLPDELESVIQ